METYLCKDLIEAIVKLPEIRVDIRNRNPIIFYYIIP